MSTPARINAILLAAGASRRYGSCKQLLDIDGISMVRHAAEAILATGIELAVVTGADAKRVSTALAGLPLTLLHNDTWTDGMGTSIACGVQALLQRAIPPTAILLCLADQPRVRGTHLRRLLERHQQHPQNILVADYGDTRGPPCLFPAAFHTELAALSGDRGARSLLLRHRASVMEIDLPEARCDIDTLQDYHQLGASAIDESG